MQLTLPPARLLRLPVACRACPCARRPLLTVAWAKSNKAVQRSEDAEEEALLEEEALPEFGEDDAHEVASPEEIAAQLDDMVFGEGYGQAVDPPGHKAGFVAIIGKPNAGKSTLMNSLLGQTLSIVTEKAQTTRHKILGILSEEGYQIVFLDTPGIIQDKRNKLEERMMRNVQASVADSDALLAIIDASVKPEEALAMIQPGPDWDGPPMAVVLNKMDLLPPEDRERLTRWFKDNCRAELVIPTSALNGDNTKAVVDWVVAKLPEGPSMYPKDFVAEASERFFVSEIIRRHVFLQYRQEIPYSVAVDVVDYKERRGAKDFIDAHVIVEHDRQRGILLGQGGSALKRLSTASRQEIEEFVGRPVYLQLSVKVQPGWRKDPQLLERLGY